MNRLVLFFLILICIAACKKSNSTETFELYEEVKGYHDEAMPNMDKIHKLQSNLKVKIDSLGAIDNTDKALEDTYIAAYSALIVADTSMMNWMRSFNSDYEKLGTEEAILYLKNEKERIKDVNQKIINAIYNAQNTLVGGDLKNSMGNNY